MTEHVTVTITDEEGNLVQAYRVPMVVDLDAHGMGLALRETHETFFDGVEDD